MQGIMAEKGMISAIMLNPNILLWNLFNGRIFSSTEVKFFVEVFLA